MNLVTFHLFKISKYQSVVPTPNSKGYGVSRQAQRRLRYMQEQESKGELVLLLFAVTTHADNPSNERQCDESKPFCARCIKSKRACLGYKKQGFSIFRDQTQTTINRHHHDPAPATAVPSVSTHTMSDSPEDLALNLFFTRLGRAHRHPEAPKDIIRFLPSLYATTSVQSTLSFAIVALALSKFSQIHPGKPFLPRARWKYGQAISHLNRDLSDAFAVKQDETLLSVLLLGMVEVSCISRLVEAN